MSVWGRLLVSKKYSDGYRAKRAADPERLAALDVITQVREDGAFANLVSAATFSDYGLSGRDAAFALELAYGTLRMRGFYDAVLAQCSKLPLSDLDPLILDVLRMGAHQLLSMRVPPHAALAQTVDVARHVSSDGPSRLVNAVLRRVSESSLEQWTQRVTEGLPDLEAQSVRFSHPLWITRAFYESLASQGRESLLPELLQADNRAPKVTLVARPGLISREELLEEVGGRGEPGGLASTSVILTSGVPGKVAAVREGLAAVQDEGSQLVTELFLGAELEGRDERWVDMCAGPGGKAALMVGRAQQTGAFVLANELHQHRARLVAKTLRAFPRGGFRIRVGDGSTLPADERVEQPVDRILLDAPCTGLGSLRRRPESRWARAPKDLRDLLQTQRKLWGAAFEMLRPGGLLGYITCSPHLAETRDQVHAMLDAGGCSLVDITQAAARCGVIALPDGTVQLWPHVDGTDAMFLAVLRKDA